ncbi:hypothetical protein LRS13_20970 [Svornostia abyssi]|uniref:Uncharacterized protein n=1 Tax=Svornostia abyssi TaxID=2898438 RepID=A0ABY5PES7_9ACTN|nr:hypothetical protein LRS13_20970 [Parviterribacteraceae bacterium J379]
MDASVKPSVVDLHREDEGLDEEAPQLRVTRRNVLLFLVFVASAVAFLYFVLPQIAGLDDTWGKIEEGGPVVARGRGRVHGVVLSRVRRPVSRRLP